MSCVFIQILLKVNSNIKQYYPNAIKQSYTNFINSIPSKIKNKFTY